MELLIRHHKFKVYHNSLRKLTWSNHQVHPRRLCRVFDLNSQKYVKGLPEIKKKHGSRKIIINPLVFLCRQASGKNVTLSSSLTFHQIKNTLHSLLSIRYQTNLNHSTSIFIWYNKNYWIWFFPKRLLVIIFYQQQDK